jgi:hypothetical protein
VPGRQQDLRRQGGRPRDGREQRRTRLHVVQRRHGAHPGGVGPPPERRWSARARRRTFFNDRHKAIAVAPQCLDIPLGVTIITERPPHGAHGTLQDRVTDELVGPEVRGQLVLRDYPVTMP